MENAIVYRIDENEIRYETQEEDYDPYLKRDPKPTITNFQAFFLLIQGVLGTGIIRAAFVYKEGWLIGTIYTIVIGILCSHCLHILISSKYRLCKLLKVPHLTFGQSMERAMETGPPSLRKFGRVSHFIVDSCFILCQLALCCTYSATILSLVPALLNTFLKEWFNVEIKISILFLISLIPLVFVIFVKDLRVFARVCIFGVILLLSALGLFYWYTLERLPSFEDVKIASPDVINLLEFLGPVVLSLEAITVVSTLERDLKSPITFTKFWGVLNFAMLAIIVFQCSIGFLGCWKFENELTSSMLATFYYSDQRLKLAVLLYALALYVSYGLQGYVFVDFIWKKTQRRQQRTKNCLRILLVLASFLFMIAKSIEISKIAEFIIQIIFAITIPLLGIVFPAILEICVIWPYDFRRARGFLCKNFLLISIGVLILFIALMTNMR